LSISFVIILFLWKPDKYIQNKNIKKKKKFLLNSYKNYYELQDYDNYQNFDNHKYLNYKNDYKDDESYTNLFDNKIEDIFLTFKSKPFIQLCFVYNLSYLFNTLHLTDFPYLKNENNKNITYYFNIVWYITNIIFRFFWGSFLDFYDFKNLYLITLFLQIGTYSTFFLITKYQFLVFIYSFFNSLANSAIYTIMPYGFYLIFGWTNFSILYSINKFISMILEYYIIFLIEKFKKNDLNFLILCYLSSFCSIMSFIILCFVEIKKFDYYKHSNENAIKKKFRYNKEHNDSDSDN
jgi:Na+/melibiose symporter-like transporter